jgi:hypothetical protein
MHRPAIITESELDAWAIHTAAGDVINIWAIGNSTARPDADTHRYLSAAPKILLNLDNDEAGQHEVPWWQAHYSSSAKPWCSVVGKDPGEDVGLGVDLRAWVLGGCAGVQQVATTSSNPTKADVLDKARAELAAIDHSHSSHSSNSNSQEATQPLDLAQAPTRRQEAAGGKATPTSNATPAKTCLHGQHCNHIRDGVCLIVEADAGGCPVSLLTRCPKDQWYRWPDPFDHPTAVVSQIIFGMTYITQKQKAKERRRNVAR